MVVSVKFFSGIYPDNLVGQELGNAISVAGKHARCTKTAPRGTDAHDNCEYNGNPTGGMYMDQMWSHILAFLSGLGTGWVAKVIISSRSTTTNRTTVVSQKNNQASGDIVAGDMHKNNRG